MGAGNWDHHPGNRRFITNFKKQRRERGDDDGGETDGGKTAHGLTSKATTSSTFVETKQDPEPAHEVGTLHSTTTTAGLLRSEKIMARDSTTPSSSSSRNKNRNSSCCPWWLTEGANKLLILPPYTKERSAQGLVSVTFQDLIF